MKQSKLFLTALLIISLIMATSTAAHAATVRHFDYNTSHKLRITGTVKTIAYSTGGGLDCNVLICTDMESAETVNVYLVGSDNYTIIWSGTVAHNTPTTFYCGSDVYYVKVQSQNSSNLGYGFAYNVS